jgi:hypothetical protein
VLGEVDLQVLRRCSASARPALLAQRGFGLRKRTAGAGTFSSASRSCCEAWPRWPSIAVAPAPRPSARCQLLQLALGLAGGLRSTRQRQGQRQGQPQQQAAPAATAAM